MELAYCLTRELQKPSPAMSRSNLMRFVNVAFRDLDSTKVEVVGSEADTIESLASHFLADSVVTDDELTVFGQHIKLLESAQPFTYGLSSTKERAAEVVHKLFEEINGERLNVGHEDELVSLLQNCSGDQSTGFMARDHGYKASVAKESARNDWFIGVCSASKVTLVYYKAIVSFEYYDPVNGPSTTGLAAFLNKLLKEQFLTTVAGKCPVNEVD